MPSSSNQHRMTVAITGTLSKPRDEFATRINATSNARFVTNVAGDTDYLVAARFDTVKARNAAIYGSAIITEQDLESFLEQAAFPVRAHRDTHVSNWPEITWTETVNDPELFLCEYADASGVKSVRYIYITKRGNNKDGAEYLEAFDGFKMKTYRADRVLSLQRIEKRA
jgi:hypothetical protein